MFEQASVCCFPRKYVLLYVGICVFPGLTAVDLTLNLAEFCSEV